MASAGARSKSPLVVIVGPTASGKTSLAIRLAERHGGEIICADSRTIYKDMNIGTAKPSDAEQARVQHWGIDLVDPGTHFSVADFQMYATQKINEIRKRGHIPFLVGGTGLYVDAVIFDYQFGPPVDIETRKVYEGMSVDELREYCYKNSIKLPENEHNKRYLIRTIERKGINLQRRKNPISESIIAGITTDRPLLRQRISERAEQLFNNGVVEEATMLGKKYGWESEAMTGNIYPLVHFYLEGRLSYNEMKDKFTTMDWRLAKRQMTYFRRNKFIHWLSLTEAEQWIGHKLVDE